MEGGVYILALSDVAFFDDRGEEQTTNYFVQVMYIHSQVGCLDSRPWPERLRPYNLAAVGTVPVPSDRQYKIKRDGMGVLTGVKQYTVWFIWWAVVERLLYMASLSNRGNYRLDLCHKLA